MAFGNRLAGAEDKDDPNRNRGGDYAAGAQEEEDVSAANARLKYGGGAANQSIEDFLKQIKEA